MSPPVLTARQLNRTTLARQRLLERSSEPVAELVEHLVGLQAQNPGDPYLALWSRRQHFDPDELATLLDERRAVRAAVVRATVHLVTADDCRWLRPTMQPVLDLELRRHSQYKAALATTDMAPVLDVVRRALDESPRTPGEIRSLVAARFPELDPPAVAYACRNLLPLVQVPPRGLWGRSGTVRYATVEAWLGGSVDAAPSPERMVLRYLAAFGPAAPADISAWSRLTGMKEILTGVRTADGDELRTYRDEHGRTLVDLPDAELVDPATPAPVRFLPEYDNALLSHADRSRFLDPVRTAGFPVDRGPVHGTVLHDGTVFAVWRRSTDPEGGRVTVTVHHVVAADAATHDAVTREGLAMLTLLAPDADHEVRLTRSPAG